MGIFSKPKDKDELIAVFNIGSSSVSGALFFARSSGIPKIVFSVTEPLRMEEKVDPDKLLSSVLESLDKVSAKLYKAGLGSPKRVFCVLSSPWYASQTRTISFKKNTPFVFTEKLADELLQKEVKLFQGEYAVKYPEGDSAVRPIELKSIKTILNGYDAPNPLGLKATELEMVIFISMSGEKILKDIEEGIGRYYSGDMKFSSFAMASFAVVRDVCAKEENFLLVDIGGEVTEIFMIKKSVLRESISYPLGKNFLTRGIASRVGCTLSEAVSLMSLWKDGHAEEAVAKKITSVVATLRAEWLKSFQESLAHLSKDISIPAAIYMIVESGMAEFFGDLINSEQFSQYTLTESKFVVNFIGQEPLHAAVEFEGGFGEPFLILDSVYINRFLTKIP